MRPSASPVEAVLFDIGGVVVELNDMASFLADAGVGDPAAFHDRWLRCPAVQAFESGKTDEHAFAISVIESHDLDLTAAEFMTLFRAWPKGLYAGIRELVAEAGNRVTVGCLSNTNAVHWPMFAPAFDESRMFEHAILSFEIGLMKPDREIFDHAVERLGVTPEAILFLDDNPMNVQAARAAGFRSELVVGPDLARAALMDHGVL